MLDGGAGYDTADYGGSDAGVTVNLTTSRGQQGGHAGGDSLTGIEELKGSSHADLLIGDGRDNDLQGREGDDTLISGAGNDNLHGGAGADRLDGGDGHDDWVRYWGSDVGVTVNLATGTGQGGHAEGDTLTGIENINGSDHADHLTGDDGDNGLNGDGGNDTLEGGAGDDWLYVTGNPGCVCSESRRSARVMPSRKKSLRLVLAPVAVRRGDQLFGLRHGKRREQIREHRLQGAADVFRGPVDHEQGAFDAASSWPTSRRSAGSTST